MKPTYDVHSSEGQRTNCISGGRNFSSLKTSKQNMAEQNEQSKQTKTTRNQEKKKKEGETKREQQGTQDQKWKLNQPTRTEFYYRQMMTQPLWKTQNPLWRKPRGAEEKQKGTELLQLVRWKS